MGLAIAIVYFPTLLVLSVVSILISGKIKKSCLKENEVCKYNGLHDLIFVVVAVGITAGLLFIVKHKSNTDFEALFTQITISLLAPYLLSVVSIIIAVMLSGDNKSKCLSLGFRLFSAVSLHAVWAFPIMFFTYINIAN